MNEPPQHAGARPGEDAESGADAAGRYWRDQEEASKRDVELDVENQPHRLDETYWGITVRQWIAGGAGLLFVLVGLVGLLT